MSRILPIVLSLTAFGQALADQPNAGKADMPQHLIGKIKGEHISLHILPDDAMPNFKKLKGTRLINVEPGCLMLEAFCDLVDVNRLRIRMPLEGYFTKVSMLRMGVNVKDVIVEFEPSDSPKSAGRIIGISPVQDKPSEQDGTGQPAEAPHRFVLDPRLEKWAPGTVRVEAVVFNGEKGDRGLVENGKKHPFVVDSETKILSAEQLRNLVDIIEGDYEPLPQAGCYIPHHGFIFYDERGQIVAHLEACLLCGHGRGIPPEGIAKTLHLRGPNEMLGPFLASIGIPVFEELAEWHEYFASKE